MKPQLFPSSITSAPRLLALSAALGGAALLVACGGGGDDNTPQPPKPNPVTVAPTLDCSAAGKAASNASTAASTVCMLTSDGEIVVELDARAPITVDNFQQYVAAKYYDNTIFHRVVPGFVAQGGGFTTGLVQKTAGQRAAIKLESGIAGLSNTKYTIAMARGTASDTATSEFYFNSVDNSAILDKTSSSAGYAVFGRVISGQATIDKINAEPSQQWMNIDTPRTEVLLYWAIRLK
ncbi:peptidylprolyl isomerase [Roseateles chitinivorans]|uniref:peptidylprolyl isomerase n=1 Tax=Roseateles chitinivorans TaxID=2917965 RepID=UPI003D665202